MGFLKTSFWGGLSTGINMICGLVTTKYVAMIIGPEGMAYTGQFANAVAIIALFATGACATGVVKYISEHKDDERRRSILSNAFLIAGISILLTSVIVIGCSQLLAKNVFNDGSYWDVFAIYGVLLLFPTFNTLASAVFNGLQRIQLMATISIAASVLNLLAVVIGASLFQIKGVLLATAVSSLFSFFIYAYFIRQTNLFPVRIIHKLYERSSVKLLLGFSAMSIVSGIVAPSIQLIVRTKLLHNFDSHTAGLWQANTRLSDYYLNFVYTVLGIYYIPKLSETTDATRLKREVHLAFIRFLPPVIIITLGIWFCRHLIVSVFLTTQFEGMLVLLKWQLIGDVIKIASWFLGYLLVAKAFRKAFIATEIIFSTTFVLLSYVFINSFGLVGTVYAFALNYLLYLLTLAVILRRQIF